MSIGNARDGLAEAMEVISGLRVYAEVPAAFEVPCGFVRFAGRTPGETFDGATTLRFQVVFLRSIGNVVGAQRAVDALLDAAGEGSLEAAIDADPTLGGRVDFCRLTDVGAEDGMEFGGFTYIGAPVSLEVMD